MRLIRLRQVGTVREGIPKPLPPCAAHMFVVSEDPGAFGA
jgi:hypothetical protein